MTKMLGKDLFRRLQPCVAWTIWYQRYDHKNDDLIGGTHMPMRIVGPNQSDTMKCPDSVVEWHLDPTEVLCVKAQVGMLEATMPETGYHIRSQAVFMEEAEGVSILDLPAAINNTQETERFFRETLNSSQVNHDVCRHNCLISVLFQGTHKGILTGVDWEAGLVPHERHAIEVINYSGLHPWVEAELRLASSSLLCAFCSSDCGGCNF